MGSFNQQTDKISLSVFLPCYNEQDSIGPLAVRAVEVLQSLKADWQLIIVNDGSTDNTAAVAEDIARTDNRIVVAHHEKNQGYGAALRTGFKTADKELVFYTDADGQFDIYELKDIIPLIQNCDVVSCYRRARNDTITRKISGWAWTSLVNLLFGIRLKDIDCAFKLYKTQIFDNITLTSTGALIDAEILAKASAAGYSITQRPVSHYPRTAGTQTGANPRVIARAFIELFKLYRRFRLEQTNPKSRKYS